MVKLHDRQPNPPVLACFADAARERAEWTGALGRLHLDDTDIRDYRADPETFHLSVMLDAGGTGIRVKTGHEFFLPKDASGTAVVFGELKPVELSAEQAQHYNDESGGGIEAGREWQILATSIVIEP